MPRRRRSVVGLCIAVIVLAALLPGMSAFDCALLEPQWVLLPDEVVVPVYTPATLCDVQPASLQSVLSSRAPPLPPLA
jgi:hypothetical protein